MEVICLSRDKEQLFLILENVNSDLEIWLVEGASIDYESFVASHHKLNIVHFDRLQSFLCTNKISPDNRMQSDAAGPRR